MNERRSPFECFSVQMNLPVVDQHVDSLLFRLVEFHSSWRCPQWETRSIWNCFWSKTVTEKWIWMICLRSLNVNEGGANIYFPKRYFVGCFSWIEKWDEANNRDGSIGSVVDVLERSLPFRRRKRELFAFHSLRLCFEGIDFSLEQIWTLKMDSFCLVLLFILPSIEVKLLAGR